MSHWGYFGSRESTPDLYEQLLLPAQVVAIDVETPTLDDRRVLGLSISTSPFDSFWFPCETEINDKIPWQLLSNPAVKKVFHNAMFDLGVIPEIGPIDVSNIYDTNVLAHLLGYLRTSLTELSLHIDREAEGAKEFMARFGVKRMDLAPINDVGKKCCNDSQVTLALYYEWKDRLPQTLQGEYWDKEMQAIPILIKMGKRGIKIDHTVRQEWEEKLSTSTEYYKQLAENEGFMISSNQQVAYVLAKRGNFLPFTKLRRKTDGSWAKRNLCVGVEVLELLDDPLAAIVLDWRKDNKLLTTYFRPLKGQDRFTTHYNLDAAVGRVSSSDRNIQNIPDPARPMLLPDSGLFTIGDFSQEHLRILAHWSQDRAMLDIYDNGMEDGDIHKYTAKQLNMERKPAKTVNYNIIYSLFTRACAKSLSQTTKIRDLRRCSEIADNWARTFPQAADWIRGAQEYGLRTGWSMPTMFGRSIKLPDIEEEGEDGVRRKACNYPILGSDGEVIKRALIMTQHLNPVITVHDEITYEGDVSQCIPEEIEFISGFHVPFDVKVSTHWE